MSRSALKRILLSPKFIATFLVIVLGVSIFLPLATVYAQSAATYPAPPQNTQTNGYMAPNTDANVPQNQHTYVQSLFIEMLSSVTCIVAGVDPTNPQGQCLGIDQATKKIGYVSGEGGLIGMGGGLIADLYTQPASSSDYAHYLSENFGITKRTYAATDAGGADSSTSNVSGSIGSTELTSLLGIWSEFRNIAYLFFVLAFIIIGVAIMLRLKIDPRTVMTIQNAIPKIIIGLLLITFSYAIAGLMIDTMYAASYLLFNTIGQPSIISSQSQLYDAQKHFNGENPIGFVNDLIGVTSFAGGTAGQLREQVTDLLSVPDYSKTGVTKKSDVLSWAAALGAGGVAALGCSFILPVIGTIACGVGATALVAGVASPLNSSAFDGIRNAFAFVFSALASVAAFLILAIAIVVMLFRVWFILLKAYILILLDIVLAPLWILFGIIPNSSWRFDTWFRHLLSHLAVFPATLAIFLLARAIMDSFTNGPSGMFVPPLIGNPSGGAINYIIGLGFLLITPTLLDQIRDAIKSPASKHNGEIGRGIGRGFAPAQYAGGRAFRKDQHGHYAGFGAVWGGYLLTKAFKRDRGHAPH